MPFSAFARPGNGFRCSSAKPLGQAIYESFRASHGENFDEGGPMSARWFAWAMAIARARSELERAKNQSNPLRCWDLLKAHEAHYGIAVPTGATLASRRLALSAKHSLTLGPVRANVEYQLTAAIGDDFIAWVTEESNGDQYYTVDPWLIGGPGIFRNPPSWTRVLLTATDTDYVIPDDGNPHTDEELYISPNGAMPFPGIHTAVGYEHVGGDEPQFAVGDVLLIAPNMLGLSETVVITHLPGADEIPTLIAVFEKAHDVGTEAIIWPWPKWNAYPKHSLVVVANGRALDFELRARVTEVMRRLMGGNSTWDIVEENETPGSSGPLDPDEGSPGITPLAEVTW